MGILSKRIKKLQGEIAALKMAPPFNVGGLGMISTARKWRGTVVYSKDLARVAVFEVKFTRSDGIRKTPIVQFAYSLTPDERAFGHYGSYLEKTAIGNDSVTIRILLDANLWWPYGAVYEGATGELEVAVHAYSAVAGNLTIARLE